MLSSPVLSPGMFNIKYCLTWFYHTLLFLSKEPLDICSPPPPPPPKRSGFPFTSPSPGSPLPIFLKSRLLFLPEFLNPNIYQAFGGLAGLDFLASPPLPQSFQISCFMLALVNKNLLFLNKNIKYTRTKMNIQNGTETRLCQSIPQPGQYHVHQSYNSGCVCIYIY